MLASFLLGRVGPGTDGDMWVGDCCSCLIQTGSCVGSCYAPFNGKEIFCQCKNLEGAFKVG